MQGSYACASFFHKFLCVFLAFIFVCILICVFVFCWLSSVNTNSITKTLQRETTQVGRIKWNNKYIIRVLWRLFTILHRLCLFLLIWRIIGGSWLIAIVVFEFLFYFGLYYITNEIIFLESIMGYVWQKIKPTRETKFILDDIHDFESFFSYQRFTGVIYFFVVCVYFIISSTMKALNDAGCCQGTEVLQLLAGIIGGLVGCGFFTVCCTYICRDVEGGGTFIVNVITRLRTISLFFLCILFDYYVFFGLILLDLIVVAFLSLKLAGNKFYFSHFFVSYCVFGLMITREFPSQRDYFDSLLFSFQFFQSFNEFIFVFVYVLYSQNINISLVNSYDTTVSYVLNDNDIFIGLLWFVGILTFIMPIWTYILQFGTSIINENVSNTRTLEALAKSGDVFGIIEFIEFGNINNQSHTVNNISAALKTDNFRKNVFPFMKFLQQQQLMTYVFDKYQLRLDPNSQTRFVQHVTHDPKRLKRFKYKFTNDEKLLESFFDHCLDDTVKIELDFFSDGMVLYSQVKSKVLWNLMIQLHTKEQKSHAQKQIADISSMNFDETIRFISVYLVETRNENSMNNNNKTIEANFYIDWKQFSVNEQIKIIVHCVDSGSLCFESNKLQQALLDSWIVSSNNNSNYSDHSDHSNDSTNKKEDDIKADEEKGGPKQAEDAESDCDDRISEKRLQLCFEAFADKYHALLHATLQYLYGNVKQRELRKFIMKICDKHSIHIQSCDQEKIVQILDNDVKDSNKFEFDTFSIKYIPLLYHQMESLKHKEQIYQYFLNFLRSDSAIVDWDPPVDISCFNTDAIEEIINMMKSLLNKVNCSQQLIEWFETNGIDQDETKNALLSKFNSEMNIKPFAVEFALIAYAWLNSVCL